MRSFRSQGAHVIPTPIRAPIANAFAERVVKTVRLELLDWTLILSRRHLDQVLRTYVSHYNAERPHRGLELAVPDKPCTVAPIDEVPAIGCRDLFGGLIREYRVGPSMTNRRFGTPHATARDAFIRSSME